MSKKEKLLQRLRILPNDFSFHEFETILEQFGFKQDRTNAGSHFKWRNEEKNIVYAAPRKNPMKRIYLKQFLEILDLYFIT